MPWHDFAGNTLQPKTLVDGVLMDTSSITTPPVLNTEAVSFTTTGRTFSPKVESTASIVWTDETGMQIASGAEPMIDFGSDATRTVKMTTVESNGLSTVSSINLGFDAAQDAGLYGPGPSHNHTPTSVSGVTGLANVPNLEMFMAADTELSGHVDFSGLSKLKFIECYRAKISTVSLEGCAALERLCLEQNSLVEIDLNPVASTLRDFRAADQTTYGFSFVPQTNPLTALYHYCIRNGVIVNTVPHAMMPVIEERWDWDNHLTTIDSPISPFLRNYNTYGNPYDQATVDRILVALDELGRTNGYILVAREWGPSTPEAPSAVGLAARDSLISKGWEVYITPPA